MSGAADTRDVSNSAWEDSRSLDTAAFASSTVSVQPVCQLCGRSPAEPFVVRRHRGLLVMMRMYQVKPTLCRDHATKLLLNWTGRSLVEGWWGVISFLVANPVTILLNLFNLAKARRMERPQLSTSLASTTASTGPWKAASSG
jgi:hypothetical protein